METPELPLLTLGNMAEGAAEELFGDALKQVLASLNDPNTDYKVPRVITMKFVFKNADETRKMAGVGVVCNVKTPPIKPVGAVIYMGMEKGELAAVEAPPQRDMFQTPAGKPREVVAGGDHE